MEEEGREREQDRETEVGGREGAEVTSEKWSAVSSIGLCAGHHALCQQS